MRFHFLLWIKTPVSTITFPPGMDLACSHCYLRDKIPIGSPFNTMSTKINQLAKMILFEEMSVTQLKKLVVWFTGFVSKYKGGAILEMCELYNLLTKSCNTKTRKASHFCPIINNLFKSKSLIDTENKSRFSYLWSRHFTYVNKAPDIRLNAGPFPELLPPRQKRGGFFFIWHSFCLPPLQVLTSIYTTTYMNDVTYFTDCITIILRRWQTFAHLI